MALDNQDKQWLVELLDGRFQQERGWSAKSLDERFREERAWTEKWLDERFRQERAWIDERFAQERVWNAEQLEKVETKLLTAFHEWARTYEVRARGAATAVAQFEERLGYIEERVARLERTPPRNEPRN